MIMDRRIIEKQFREYLKIYHFTNDDKAILNDLKRNTDEPEIDLKKCSEDFFNYLINESDLDVETKTNITLTYKNLITNFPSNKLVSVDSSVYGIDQVLDFYNQNLKNELYNFEVLFYGKIIPVYAKFELVNASRSIPRHINVSFNIVFFDKFKFEESFAIYHKTITNLKAKLKKINFYDLMGEFNLHKVQVDLEAYQNLIARTNELKLQNGTQFLTNCYVIEVVHRSSSFNPYSLSNNEAYSRIIIESTLELENHKENIGKKELETYYTTPYVRVFSMAKKSYFLIHVEDIIPYTYDENAFAKLIIPEETKSVLMNVFSSNIKDYYSDFIKSKHGGMVILAEGPTGVGKTSTAEVYAELLKKPLYMVQLDELGTNPESIENKLAIIFKRVQKWNAVLLFDEIDVYLFKRDTNLNQSAVVGVFLRLLDYFSGLIFFTTNRSDVLDKAILSRVSLKIKYEELSESTQLAVWKSKLIDANVSIDSTEKLSKLNLNGRQIKNTIRVAKVMYGNRFKEAEVINLLKKYIL